MTHVWAVVLGLVQGIAEFLPISSTAHLKMLPWVFNLHEAFLYSTPFDIALHAGSFIAILVALWADWVDLVRGAVARDRAKLRFVGFLLLTSVPGALIGALFDQKVEVFSTPANPGMPASETFHYAPLLVGVALIVFGALLWAVDRFAARQDPLEEMTWGKAAWVGVAQALALVPGVSRSGSTMTAGRMLGFSREAVARYSFMAALPIIGGAAVFGLRHVSLHELLSLDWVLGFVAAAISSFAAVRFMLEFVKRRSFALFAYYRLAVGLAIIALFLIRG
jgi:undecaprenyl-diphosphatase